MIRLKHLTSIGAFVALAARRVAHGELMRLIGEAERARNQTPMRIAQFVMAAKGMD